MGIRRLVKGHDTHGKAGFASDVEVEPVSVTLLPGTEFSRLWGADHPCQFPDDGSMPVAPDYFPPLGGFRFGLFTLAPDAVAMPVDLDMDAIHRAGR